MVTFMAAQYRLLNARSLARLGDAVAGLRKKRELTQRDLARDAKVSRQWLNALENGRTSGLEVGRLMRLLDTLDASLMIRDEVDEQ
jgi:HTH-type transcriptional regulator/antitoxin HipB